LVGAEQSFLSTLHCNHCIVGHKTNEPGSAQLGLKLET
jgi:hypothetical protein